MYIWYKTWDMKNKSVVLSIEFPMSNSHWRKEPTYSLSDKDLAEGIIEDTLYREYMLQVMSPVIKRSRMKYVDFKGREWSVEKGDWISYQMLDKQNQQSLFNKNTLKKYFYIIFLALLTAYFWLV